MGKILDALARADLCVIPSDEKPGPEYKKACECSSSYIEQPNERLSPEDKERLDQVVDALLEENRISTDESFIRGFRLGARLIMEVMEEEQIVPSDKRYPEMRQELDELLKTLEKEAEPGIWKKLERFCDLSGEMENMELTETFCAGFRLGAQIMQEVFTEEQEIGQSQE